MPAERSIIRLPDRAAERKAAVMAGTSPVAAESQPRQEEQRPAGDRRVRNFNDPRSYQALLDLPGYWLGASRTRAELAGTPGWSAPALSRSLDVKIHRRDGREVLDTDRQETPLIDPFNEGRLKELRIERECWRRAKELETGGLWPTPADVGRLVKFEKKPGEWSTGQIVSFDHLHVFVRFGLGEAGQALLRQQLTWADQDGAA